jgi:hypothetical protein
MALYRKILYGVFVLTIVCGIGFLLYPKIIGERIRGVVKATQEVATNVGIPSVPIIGNTASDEPLTHAGIITDTNTERTDRGLGLLHENSELDAAAEVKLEDMFNQQYFDHIAPNGNGPGLLLKMPAMFILPLAKIWRWEILKMIKILWRRGWRAPAIGQIF